MHIYERLGVKTVVNAQGSISKIGGSIMAPEVVAAMTEAAQCYVEISELLSQSGRHLSKLLGVEAAFITSGAAAGLVLSAAACMTGTNPAKIFRLPDTADMKHEVIIHRQQRNHYDSCLRQAGARLVEIGLSRETPAWELEDAISPKTAAIVYFIAYARSNSIPLRQLCEIAHRAGVPVIVDAADELPPASNLKRYLDEGADLAIFSGGKAIGGPQASGLILGRRDLIEACTLNGFPNYAIGRPMKVGKEEIAGLVVAVERYLLRDFDAEFAARDRQVTAIMKALAHVAGLGVERIVGVRDEPELHPFAVPRVLLTLGPTLAVSRDDVVRRLKAGDPPVHVLPVGRHLVVTTQGLRPGDEHVVAERIRQVVSLPQPSSPS